MENLIRKLISYKKEGIWWDFKQEFHEDMASLVHDIICMANVVCKEDRYIVFGVSDSLKIVGLPGKGKSYTQPISSIIWVVFLLVKTIYLKST